MIPDKNRGAAYPLITSALAADELVLRDLRPS